MSWIQAQHVWYITDAVGGDGGARICRLWWRAGLHRHDLPRIPPASFTIIVSWRQDSIIRCQHLVVHFFVKVPLPIGLNHVGVDDPIEIPDLLGR